MKKDYFVYIVLGMLLLVAGVYGFAQYQMNKALAAVVIDSGIRITPNIVKEIDLLTSTSTAATSSPTSILGAKKVTIVAVINGRIGTTTGKQSVLSITGSGIASSTDVIFDQDATTTGDTYFPINKLIDNLTNSNSQTLTRVRFKSLAASSTMLSIDLEYDVIEKIRCHVSNINVIGDTGQGVTCRAIIQY